MQKLCKNYAKLRKKLRKNYAYVCKLHNLHFYAPPTLLMGLAESRSESDHRAGPGGMTLAAAAAASAVSAQYLDQNIPTWAERQLFFCYAAGPAPRPPVQIESPGARRGLGPPARARQASCGPKGAFGSRQF